MPYSSAQSTPSRTSRRASREAPSGSGCSIGQAAAISGVSAKMIRYYESIGLTGPVSRSAANYRSYDEAAIQTLRFIARARTLGFSLDEIAKLLALWREPGRSSADVKALALRHVADLKMRIAALQSMKAALETLADHCHGNERPECPILEEFAGEPGAKPKPRRLSHG